MGTFIVPIFVSGQLNSNHMDWKFIVTTLVGILFGGGGSVLFYRSKLREARTNADKAQSEYLEGRLASMSRMYEEQGKALDDVRSRVLELSKSILDKDERIAQLESENRKLSAKVAKLEKELTVYRNRKA